MRVEVTREDIDLGERGVATRCPIARALRRTTGKVWEVLGYRAVQRWDGGERRAALRLPAAVTCFVDDFDDGKPVEPFDFEAEEVPFGP